MPSSLVSAVFFVNCSPANTTLVKSLTVMYSPSSSVKVTAPRSIPDSVVVAIGELGLLEMAVQMSLKMPASWSAFAAFM